MFVCIPKNYGSLIKETSRAGMGSIQQNWVLYYFFIYLNQKRAGEMHREIFVSVKNKMAPFPTTELVNIVVSYLMIHIC